MPNHQMLRFDDTTVERFSERALSCEESSIHVLHYFRRRMEPSLLTTFSFLHVGLAREKFTRRIGIHLAGSPE